MNIQMIPTPKTGDLGQTKHTFRPVLERAADFPDAADVFIRYAEKLNIPFRKEAQGVFRPVRVEGLKAGAYRLKTEDAGVTLAASDETGIHHAFAALLQLMEPGNGGVDLPLGEICDQADCDYRGLMVDLARVWHDESYLLKYVDICYFYKLSVLHLHFTDDQSYTLPSEIYPGLSTPGRHYTREQIAQLVDYAAARGVELMPEINVPGHCGSFQGNYRDLFGTGGIIHQHPESMKAMRAIFREVCEMFPNSRRIHIGGDEAKIAQWTICAQCLEYARRIGIDTAAADRKFLAQQMYARFVNQMAEAVLECGRIPVAWEGFSKEVNAMVSKKILVMSWENFYQLTGDLLEGGFEILNCSWNPLYIVEPARYWTPKEIYDWNLYTWSAVHPASPYLGKNMTIRPDERVRGAQLLVWGDQIEKNFANIEEGVREECVRVLERIPYVAENTWNIEKRSDYETVAAACRKQEERLKTILNF